MAIFSVEGKLGTGKTKFCIWQAQQALQKHRRVASNVDIKAEVLHPYGKRSILRIPDKPTAFDLEAMGHGNPESYDEDMNGVLILDELGTWLNSRSFQDKGRAHLLDWLIHARKHGWDVYLIVQDAGMIDKQVREALIEYQARCVRMDKVRIPVLGRFTGLIREKWGYFPKFHMVTARVGYGQGQIVAERWTYRGNDLHSAYDTRQVFRSDYEHGTFCTLPPWDFQPKKLPMQALKDWFKEHRAKLQPPKRTYAPKPPLLQWVQKLPPDRRIAFIRKHPQCLRL